MGVRRFEVRRLVLFLTVLAVFGLAPAASHAAMILVDPGVVGQQSNSPILTTTVSAGDPFLDIVFTDMKHVEALQWGFANASGPIFFAGFFLTDEFGQEIPGTNADGINTTGLLANSTFPIIAHDIHFVFELGQDVTIDVIVDGLVGEWGDDPVIPEPSTFALLGIGSIALVGYGWRKKRKTAA